jgi:uncharacterized membrane protein YidH (DUF202 family)
MNLPKFPTNHVLILIIVVGVLTAMYSGWNIADNMRIAKMEQQNNLKENCSTE